MFDSVNSGNTNTDESLSDFVCSADLDIDLSSLHKWIISAYRTIPESTIVVVAWIPTLI